MSHFFIRTDAGVVGPVSDIELRELAFAGILRPESEVASSPDGVWQSAVSIEIFSTQKLPAPHPPGTVLPLFEAEGLPPMFHGPFKLRELFGFAARGFLPPEAFIKGDAWEEWLPVLRFPTLAWCLNGDLVMLGPNGQLVHRAIGGSNSSINLRDARIPMEIAQEAALKRASLFEDTPTQPAIVDEGYEAEQAVLRAASAEAIATATASARLQEDSHQEVSQVSQYISLLRSKFTFSNSIRKIAQSKRFSRGAIATLVLFAAGLAWMFYPAELPKQRIKVIGEWMGGPRDTATGAEPSFSMLLRDDGNCEVFTSSGPTWQGNFFYSENHGMDMFYESLMPVKSVVASIQPRHHRDQVQSSDGYIRFASLDGTFPEIDGHSLQEAFVRPVEGQLQLGYLAGVDWTPEEKSLEAGWITLIRAESKSN